ncbi:MAG TPA: glycoside hydrolase family 2 TIM barrel-domain containing protein, partial [Gemmatimonadaceae bacterium]|nr:glycoside hydrolase family 2 TIM barrel-domain containing protein [Gemmatimonadaceae bacterium]
MTRLALPTAAFLLTATALPLAAQAPRAPGILRQRIALDTGWRFHLGDPPGNTVALRYERRPDVAGRRDDGPADARPTVTAGATARDTSVLRPWILPMANPFIRDPARRHAPPASPWSGDVPYLRADFDDGAWRRVTLPHDWAIEGPWLTTGDVGGMGRLPTAGVAWYRRTLHIPARDADRSIFLDVDGAMSYATVWLNGRLVGGWPYGYASWRVDLTSHVVPGGVNQLAIRLDNPPASSRWYPGAGLYRDVWLTTTAPVHVAHWGTVVRTRRLSRTSATLDLDVTVDNDGRQNATVRVATRIHTLDAAGRPTGIAVAASNARDVLVPAGASRAVRATAIIADPRRWGPPPRQRPHRYLAVTTLSRGGRVVDRYETRFGIREVRFDPDSGVRVNGERIPLRGVNMHHDLGALGAAFNVRAAERQLEKLREMGANAIRMSHNPPAPELLELTDRMGFLVMDEAFDVWARGKTPLDHHLFFADWHEADLRAMVRRDRNNPSVILWSIGNEVGEQYTGAEGAALARRLVDIVREEDPTRPVTAAMNYAGPEMPLPAVLDVISLN